MGIRADFLRDKFLSSWQNCELLELRFLVWGAGPQERENLQYIGIEYGHSASDNPPLAGTQLVGPASALEADGRYPHPEKGQHCKHGRRSRTNVNVYLLLTQT